jgi:hypothetical protein
MAASGPYPDDPGENAQKGRTTGTPADGRSRLLLRGPSYFSTPTAGGTPKDWGSASPASAIQAEIL